MWWSNIDSYEDDPAAPGERRLCSSSILPPLEISVTEEELRLFRYICLHCCGSSTGWTCWTICDVLQWIWAAA